jgi:hypothetical protein
MIALIVGGIAAVVLVVALVAVLVSGDDGDGDISSGDASVEEFCDAYSGIAEAMMSVADPNASPEEQAEAAAEALNEWADEMGDVGVPDEMSDEARDGFELIVETAGDLDAGDLEDLSDLEALEEDFSEDEQEAVAAFEDFATENCTGSIDDLPSLPTDVPTELPSDLPTDFLSEFPTEFPSDFPTEFLPSDFPSEYLTMLPSDWLTAFPTE